LVRGGLGARQASIGFGRRPFLFLTIAKVDPAVLAHGGDWYAGTYYAVLAASP